MNKKLKTAIAIHQAGDLDTAEARYLDLLSENANDSDLLHLLSILNAQKKNLDSALSYIRKAIRISPRTPSLHNSLGNIYKNQKKWQQAITAYHQAIELNPHNASALSNLGNLFYDQKKWEEAIQYYQSALKMRPSADTYCNLGLAYKMLHTDQKAQSAFEKAIEIDPLHSSARMELGKYAQLMNQPQEALVHYEHCLKADPHHIEAKNNLGAIFLTQKQFSKAIDLFKEVLSRHPKQLESLSNLASAYLQSGSLDNALLYYLQLLEIEQAFDTYYNLGVIYMYKEYHQSAIDYFNQALTLHPQDVNTHLNLGSIYLKMDDHSKAIQHYEMALKLSPNHPESHYLLAALQHDNITFTSAPSAYVQSLFDQYAPYFDEHLNQYLHYQSPQALYKAVTNYVGTQTSSAWDILDLGCGTGLCGVLFRPLATCLTGIDLSPKMIDMAHQKACYDVLITDTIESSLSKFTDQDLILAADVLTYIGDLTRLFHLIFRALKSKGLFAFTTEITWKENYVLQTSARYAHQAEYIKALSAKVGLTIVIDDNVILREQKKQPLEGMLWLLQKP